MFQDGVLSFSECSSAIRTLGLRQSGNGGPVDYFPAIPAILTLQTGQTGLMKQKINSLPDKTRAGLLRTTPTSALAR